MKSTPLLAALCCLLWACAFVFIKIGLPFSAPLQFAGQRFFLSGLAVLLWWLLAGGSAGVGQPGARGVVARWGQLCRAGRASWGRLLLLGALQIGIKYALFYQGLALVPASLGALIGGSGPLVAVMLTTILPPYERLNRRTSWALGLGMVGIVTLTLGREQMGAIGPMGLVGIILLVINILISVLGDWVVAHYARDLPAPLISGSSLVLGGLMLLGAGIGYEGFIPPAAHWRYWGALLALCTISGGAITLWFVLLQRPGVQVGALSMWKFLIPLLGACIAWLVMPDEQPTVWAVVGMVLISVAVWLLPHGSATKREGTPRQCAQPPSKSRA